MNDESKVRIAGGTVEYGENRKIADYENKTSKVTLTFGVPDGYTLEAGDVEHVVDLAKGQVHKALDVVSKARARTGNPSVGSAEPKPATVQPPPVAAISTQSTVSSLATSDPTAIDVVSAGSAGMPGNAPTSEAKSSVPPSTDATAIDDVLTGVPADISDKNLSDAFMKKNKSSELKLTNKIRELIGKYAGVGKVAADIPQDKRAAVLAELEAMKL